jgi:hypothetical protein
MPKNQNGNGAAFGITYGVRKTGTCLASASKQTRIPPHSEWDELSQRLLAKDESRRSCLDDPQNQVQSAK